MPRVERYGGRKVATEALTGGRRTASETALSTGAGLAQAEAQRGEALAGVGQTVFRASRHIQEVQEQEKDWADRVALDEARVKLGKWGNRRLYDPQSGALTIRGKDAMPLPEQVSGEFNQVANEIEAGLSSDRQRALFQRIKAQEAEGLDGQLRRHVFTEMRAYEAGVVEATIDTSYESAVAHAPDPRLVQIDLNKAVATITGAAKSQGWSPEVVQAKVDKVQSAMMTGVINNLLAADKTELAKKYFRDNKDLIKGDALTKVQAALEEGTLRGEAQKKSDEILAVGGTLTQQREQARAIDDPQLRDQVMQRIEHEASVRAVADREQEEQTLTNAYNILDKTHDVRNIPPATWANLPGSARSALRGYAEHLARGTPVDTDLPTYYALMEQAATDPETFVAQNLLNYRHKLGEGEFKQFAQMQASLRTGDRKAAEKVLDDFRTEKGVIDETLSRAGLDPNPGKDDKDGRGQIARFHGLVADEVRRVQDITKRKVSNEEVEAIATRILGQQITTKGWFWDTTKRAIEATVSDVPAADREQIVDALRRHGQPVTDDSVLDVWLKGRIRRGGE